MGHDGLYRFRGITSAPEVNAEPIAELRRFAVYIIERVQTDAPDGATFHFNGERVRHGAFFAERYPSFSGGSIIRRRKTIPDIAPNASIIGNLRQNVDVSGIPGAQCESFGVENHDLTCTITRNGLGAKHFQVFLEETLTRSAVVHTMLARGETMRAKDFQMLVEARITEAAVKGSFDNLPGAGKPLPKDPLEGLPYEDRIAALIHRTAGSAPEEVELIREIAELRERRETAKDPEQKKKLAEALQQKALRLSMLFEASGRNVLVHSDLTKAR